MTLQIFQRSDLSVAVTPDAAELKRQALESAALISVVADDRSNAAACEAMKKLQLVKSATEKARKEIKQPVLDACRAIDAAAAAFVMEVEAESTRLARASADWQSEQTERMRAIERKRQEEADRLERERLAELRRIDEERLAKEREAAVKAAQEAAAARAEAEKAIAAAKTKAAKAQAAARAESERLAAEARAEYERRCLAAAAEKAKADAEARAAQETLTLPLAAERQKATGQTVRSEWEFEVVNPFDVFRSNPGLCKIEIRASEVKAVIASQLSAGITPPKIPGLRIFEVTKVSVRQTPAGKVVDV